MRGLTKRGVQQKYIINKNCFSCFKHEECVKSMQLPTSTTNQVLKFVKTVLTSTILCKFYTSTKIKTRLQ